MLAQQLANGVVLGCIYALAGAFFTLTVMKTLSIPFFLALLVGMVGVALLNFALFYLTIPPPPASRHDGPLR